MNEKRLQEWLSSRKRIRETRTPDLLFEAIRKGDRTALSGAITLL